MAHRTPSALVLLLLIASACAAPAAHPVPPPMPERPATTVAPGPAPSEPPPPAATEHPVARAVALWSDIRAAYPSIPDAAYEHGTYGYNAALYYGGIVDGLARLQINTNFPLEPFNVWHEAGHALQTSAGRGDEGAVLARFWAARGFPGTWVEAHERAIAAKSLPAVNGFPQAWRLSPGEALAETFAAVNVGGSERTETYAVPLDPGRMRAFFRALDAESAPRVDPRPVPTPRRPTRTS